MIKEAAGNYQASCEYMRLFLHQVLLNSLALPWEAWQFLVVTTCGQPGVGSMGGTLHDEATQCLPIAWCLTDQMSVCLIYYKYSVFCDAY